MVTLVDMYLQEFVDLADFVMARFVSAAEEDPRHCSELLLGVEDG